MINQTAEKEISSEEEENEDKEGAAYTKACIKHLMTLGQGHIGVNVGLEDCDSVFGYGFMEAPVDQASGDANKWKVQGQDGTNPLKRRGVVKEKRAVALGVTSRNKTPPKPAWVEETTKKVILKKEGSFLQAIEDEVGRLRKGEVYAPIKKPSVMLRSTKAKPGSVFAECKAFD